MRRLRTAVRLALFVPYTAYKYFALIVGAVMLGAVRGGGWTGPATAAWRGRMFQSWSRGVLRILCVRVEITGPPPDGPFFLVCNHLGYLDIILLGAQFPCVFVAKSEVAGWPAFGSLCRGANTIFIDRTNKRDIPRVIAQIEAVLGSGRGIVIFPEGSSTQGADVTRFRPSLLQTAAAAGIPVSYAALTYSTPPGAPPAHLSVCWWDEKGFVPHLLGLLGLPRIDASLTFGGETIQDGDRKVLAERLQYAVRERFRPVVGTETA